MDKAPQGTNPGLFYVLGKITKPDRLAVQEFKRWYEKVHIPDVFTVPGLDEAYRWESIDSKAERPYLTLYPVKNLESLQSQEFRDIPVEDARLPGSHNIFDFAEFDTRVYRYEQLYGPDSPNYTQPDFVISAAFTPEDNVDYDNWYREEHLKDVSKITGWRRTERYELVLAAQNGDHPATRSIEQPPKYLTLHFFDGNAVPEQELAKASESEWTKKNMSSMKQQSIDVFKKLSAFRK